VLAGCSGFVAVAVLTVPRSDPLFWVTVIFFGIGCLLSLVKLFSPWDFLRLTHHGYEEHVLFRSSHVAWKDIERFIPYKVGATPMVGIVFADSYTRQVRSRRFARSFAGVEGALSDTYGRSADELADLLNDWRVRQQPHRGQ
jgi:hypothetical protein